MRQMIANENLFTGIVVSILEVPTPSGESMKLSKYFFAGLFGLALSVGNSAFAQGNGNGHGKGHDKNHDDDGDRDDHYYKHHEKDIRGWYSENEGHLPPGLAKKDQLPPGLEKQLVRTGTLPPGLQKKVYPCPVELEHQLPPPPPDTRHVLVGGHIVLLNRKTNVVVDIFSF